MATGNVAEGTEMDLPDNIFAMTRKIRFSECDPAGIVFYPEFFRMFNDLFEDWMETAIGVDFSAQFAEHQRMFPLVHVEVDFKQPRNMGQLFRLVLVLTALGRSSIHYAIIGFDGDDPTQEILRGRFITCMASKVNRKSLPLPDDMRPAMEAYLELCDGIIE
jgi:4-hydroxybenzoyl-CoA thioesterase